MNIHQMIDVYSGKNRKRLLELSDPALTLFGINHFFMQSITSDGHYSCLGTNPDIMNDFFDQQCHKNTPFITNFNELQTGIYFYDTVENHEMQRWAQKIENKYNSKHSCVFTEKANNRCQQWGFGIADSGSGGEALIVNQRGLLKRFIKYFKTEIADLLLEIEANPINFSDEISQTNNRLPQIDLDAKAKLKFLSKIGTNIDWINEIKFSEREVDCLKHYVQGKSSRLIADELSLSQRTVEHYLENIKNKLCCEGRAELFDRLILLKDLNLYPDIFAF